MHDEEPKEPCMACGERLGQHLTMVDGKPRLVCCRCHIFVDNRLPVPWHKECPGYYDEKLGKTRSNLIIIPGRG